MTTNTTPRVKKHWQLLADDTVVWSGTARPSQVLVDAAGLAAERRGWNGTELCLRHYGVYLQMVTPACVDGDEPSGYRPEAAALYDGTPGSATLDTVRRGKGGV